MCPGWGTKLGGARPPRALTRLVAAEGCRHAGAMVARGTGRRGRAGAVRGGSGGGGGGIGGSCEGVPGRWC